MTEREETIRRLIAQGMNNADLAAQLGLSLKTVRNHVSNICSKLQVADQAQAIIRAREVGLGREEEGEVRRRADCRPVYCGLCLGIEDLNTVVSLEWCCSQ